MKKKPFELFQLSYIVKTANDEVAALIKDEEVLDILFQKGLPNCSYWDFSFDESISIRNSYIILGSYNKYDLVIDMDSDKSIFILSSDDKDHLFLNSSLGQFVGYLSAYIEFINKKITAFYEVKKDGYLLKRDEYAQEWKQYMIEKDERAYYHEQYYWGSMLEEHENGMFR